jgi:RHS repeat-associated protein
VYQGTDLTKALFQYDYDAAGNRLSEKRNGNPFKNYSFASNKLNQIDGYAYNNYGGLSAYGNESYSYDAANRLSTINYTGTTSTSDKTQLDYDGLNRPIRIREFDTTGAVTSDRQRIWCGLEICGERVNGVVNQFYYPHGEIRNGAKYFYTRDHLGSVREMTDNSGKIRAQYDYAPYGLSSKLAGDLDTNISYTGHYRHWRSGLLLAPFRAYDPTLGRWLNRDPIGEDGGFNLYGYVRNNPVNGVDPLGLQSQTYYVPGSPLVPFPYGSPEHQAASKLATDALNALSDAMHDALDNVYEMANKGERSWGKKRGDDPLWDEDDIDELKKIEKNDPDPKVRENAKKVRKMKEKTRGKPCN